MTKKDIKSKIRGYYLWKWRIAWGLIIFLALTVISVIIVSLMSLFSTGDPLVFNTIKLSSLLSGVGVVSYIILLGFVFVAALFPIGKYSIDDKIQKGDITELLSYIIELKCDYNEQYDSLMVISRTTKAMVSKIIGWARDDYEGSLNTAWNMLNRYFRDRVISKINFEHFQYYCKELLSQLNEDKISINSLNEILEGKWDDTSNKAQDKRARRILPAEFWIYIICTAALLLLIVFKVASRFIKIDPSSQNIVMKLIWDVGSDIIAVVFAMFSIKTCWISTFEK